VDTCRLLDLEQWSKKMKMDQEGHLCWLMSLLPLNIDVGGMLTFAIPGLGHWLVARYVYDTERIMATGSKEQKINRLKNSYKRRFNKDLDLVADYLLEEMVSANTDMSNVHRMDQQRGMA